MQFLIKCNRLYISINYLYYYTFHIQVLTIRTACILATIFETLGSVLIGSKVSDTIRKGIIDITPYQNNTQELMMGNVAALSGKYTYNTLYRVNL